MELEENRIMSARSNGEEEESLRPQSLEEYVGQDALKDNPCGQGDELTPIILIRPLA